jgi:8-oxo-dGTP pyrophosphatase MutT (NUDIX family)
VDPVGDGKIAPDVNSATKEILLADYKYLCDSFWKNEETGEKRVQFFITLVTAVLAAIATLFVKAIEKGCYRGVLGIILFTLVALIIFGLITLMRIMKRNEVTDGYKKDLDEIRQRFKDFFDGAGVLSAYEPFRGPPTDKYVIRKIGGLAHTVAAINSIILAAVTVVVCGIAVSGILANMVLSASFVFLLSFVVQVIWIRNSDVQSKANLRKPMLTHAGGIVWKRVGSERQFLIITASDNQSVWVLPKGHIKEFEEPESKGIFNFLKREVKKYEDPEETAIREVAEEAGINACINGTAGYAKYKTKEEVVCAKFYLMEYWGDEKEKQAEHRQKKWCSFEEALRLLVFGDSRRLVRCADYVLEKLKL